MKRRTFLKMAGVSGLSVAAGCTADPENHLYSLVVAPDDMVAGRATMYATTCRECPAGCGVIASNHEGKVTKLEGNPNHPVNRGALCMRGQAALQGLYDPDRLRRPLLKDGDGWKPIGWQAARKLLAGKIGLAADNGKNRVHLITEVVGQTLLTLYEEVLEQYSSRPPLVFEAFPYDALKSANEAVFGVPGLPTYRLEKTDVLLTFGADFLETWLSPVEYARKFKAMHALHGDSKGIFFQVSPFQSLTGANADQWFSCRPGGEYAVALGLLRMLLASDRPPNLSGKLLSRIRELADPYTVDEVAAVSGMDKESFSAIGRRLRQARHPLVLGAPESAVNAPQTHLAANLLNLALDPSLGAFDFTRRCRVETAASRAETRSYWEDLAGAPEGVVLLSNVNPLFSMPSEKAVAGAFENQRLFKVSFSAFMDETTEQADLVLPVQLPLEMWDAYESKTGLLSTLQPAMGRFTKVPHIADILLKAARSRNGGYRDYLSDALQRRYDFRSRRQWLQTLGNGGLFETQEASVAAPVASLSNDAMEQLREVARPSGEMVLLAYPTIRFFDGRGANRSWLCEVPDPLSMVAWQTPLFLHPETADAMGLRDEDDVEIQTSQGRRTAPLYTYEGMHPNVAVVPIGQGHQSYGRYAKNQGMNPLDLVPGGLEAGVFAAQDAKLEAAGGRTALASVSGSRIQHGRKIALSTTLEELRHPKPEAHGLTMDTFPLTLPLPEGYDPDRDIYPPHEHDTYRWSMIVDLDRCVGCGACAVACYAENNLGVVGERQVIKGREMAWMRIERYQDPERMERITFLPMMCQHCDNAPCESVCPVYAPHHNKEGLNNQIYNRCIGTRFCSQNCPYKVRRFNWFTWQWPGPLKMQLNPRVTVRSKGVMEKCSFCVQRIKAAHDVAKNEKRKIRDGEVVPACVQTCPTGALVFGNLMDKASRVRKLADDRRAYQVMGYLNTKPAVIYLKKVKQEI